MEIKSPDLSRNDSDLPPMKGLIRYLPYMLVMAAAFIVYLPILFTGRVITTDDCLYAWVGRNIVSGRGITDWNGPHLMFPPGYPFLIGLAYVILGNLETACRLIAALAAIGSVLTMMLLTRNFLGRNAALVAGLLMVMNPAMIGLAYNGGSEIPFVLFTSLAITGAFGLLRDKIISGLTTGLAIGSAYLIRPEALLYIPVVLFIVFLLSRQKSIQKSIALLAIVAIFVVPYAVFLHHHLGYWTMSGKEKTLVVDSPFVTSNPEKTLYTVKKPDVGYSGDAVKLTGEKARTAFSVRVYLRNVKSAAGATIRMMGWPVVITAVLALLMIKRRKMPGYLLATLLPLPVLLTIPLFFIRDRYLACMIPMVILWAVWGMYNLSASKRVTRAVVGVIVGFTVLVGARSAVSVIREIRQDPYEQKAAGEWLAAHTDDNGAVMSRKPWTPFYADRRWVITPVADYEDTIEFARLRGVRYIIIDERLTASLRPELKFLLDTSQAPAGLRVMKVIDSYPDKGKMPKLVIYELTKES